MGEETTKGSSVIEDAKNLLEYAQVLGFKEVEVKDISGRCDEGAAVTKRKTSAMSDEQKRGALEELRSELGECTRCKLCKGRRNVVFGAGNPAAKLMFIGEGPGRDEDVQGEPFVGRAGQLLTKIIEAMGYKRSDVYIANIVKCRPPNNRNPEPDEVATCKPFLIRQVEIIEPAAIVCLGSVAAQNLLETEDKISRIRGNFTEWAGTPVMPTYHPAFLLRNSNMKKPVWEDMQLVMKLLSES